MGTRLTILNENEDILFYGDKLYGYVKGIEKSKALKYIWDKHGESMEFEDYDTFLSDLDCLPTVDKVCKLSIDELHEFIKLYDEDVKMFGRNCFLSGRIRLPENVQFVWIEWG